ncbi:peptidase T [Polluticaenibacter yanchengensis]|uniref:Peptidase T n=1 Tax=Polluticaenibacter yanchengensis TaxID=3014562 RepID=A0ABT4UL90_9BACT|nr:peptidase T [Chitinophagaceae bacterium LY-5]
MFHNDYAFTVTERFLRYVQIYTQSNPNSTTFPSSTNQFTMLRLLVEELKEMGIEDAEMDQYGYVFGTLKSNTTKNIPVICFCSHVDTAPDCSGENVKPIVHHYKGDTIFLPDDPTQLLNTDIYPYLHNFIGEKIITASGNTLLGADDKSGVAIIMDAVNYLIQHPEVEHGDIRILFTPDEEVGRGTEKLNMQKLNATYGYTLDGGEAGYIEDETFSADSVEVIVHGVSAHPGYAKDKLVNATKIAGEILANLPTTSWSPETTEKRQGFVHPVAVSGIAEKTSIKFIVRDFKTSKLKEHEDKLRKIVEDTLHHHPEARFEFIVKEQYRNMKEVLDKHPQVMQYAIQAIKEAGMEVKNECIRGGTDGSRLSFMGLPCPNIFTGMQGIHSKTEWIGIKDMQKAVETVVRLSNIWALNSK